MHALLKTALIAGSVALASQALAEVSFYQHQGFEGRSFTTNSEVGSLARFGFNDRASAVVVTHDRWEVCEDVRFKGRCVILRPGQYPSLAAMNMNDRVSSARIVNRNAHVEERHYAPASVVASITFYQHDRYKGQAFTATNGVANFARHGFDNRASSVVVVGSRWEVCENNRFGGRCMVLRPGSYSSLGGLDLNDRISSARAVHINARIDPHRYVSDHDSDGGFAHRDFHRRNNERLYEANVISVRAVVGTPTERCWIAREEIAQERRTANVPGAVAGALIGGILGHQIGDGRGQDIATAGGAVAGAAVGSQIGRDRGVETRDVERCERAPEQARPDYWDVTYHFRGQSHRMQMTSPPGATVTVNAQGEPRA